MAQSLDLFLCNGGLTANSTLLALGQASLGAGCSLAGDGLFGVAQSLDLFGGLADGLATDITDLGGLDVASLGAGCILFVLFGRGHVAKGLDHFLLDGDFATQCALLAFGVAVFGTGGILGIQVDPVMLQSVDFFLLNQDLATDGALLAFSQAGLGAGCILTGENLFSVALSIDGYNFLGNLAAVGTSGDNLLGADLGTASLNNDFLSAGSVGVGADVNKLQLHILISIAVDSSIQNLDSCILISTCQDDELAILRSGHSGGIDKLCFLAVRTRANIHKGTVNIRYSFNSATGNDNLAVHITGDQSSVFNIRLDLAAGDVEVSGTDTGLVSGLNLDNTAGNIDITGNLDGSLSQVLRVIGFGIDITAVNIQVTAVDNRNTLHGLGCAGVLGYDITTIDDHISANGTNNLAVICVGPAGLGDVQVNIQGQLVAGNPLCFSTGITVAHLGGQDAGSIGVHSQGSFFVSTLDGQLVTIVDALVGLQHAGAIDNDGQRSSVAGEQSGGSVSIGLGGAIVSPLAAQLFVVSIDDEVFQVQGGSSITGVPNQLGIVVFFGCTGRSLGDVSTGNSLGDHLDLGCNSTGLRIGNFNLFLYGDPVVSGGVTLNHIDRNVIVGQIEGSAVDAQSVSSFQLGSFLMLDLSATNCASGHEIVAVDDDLGFGVLTGDSVHNCIAAEALGYIVAAFQDGVGISVVAGSSLEVGGGCVLFDQSAALFGVEHVELGSSGSIAGGGVNSLHSAFNLQRAAIHSNIQGPDTNTVIRIGRTGIVAGVDDLQVAVAVQGNISGVQNAIHVGLEDTHTQADIAIGFNGHIRISNGQAVGLAVTDNNGSPLTGNAGIILNRQLTILNSNLAVGGADHRVDTAGIGSLNADLTAGDGQVCLVAQAQHSDTLGAASNIQRCTLCAFHVQMALAGTVCCSGVADESIAAGSLIRNIDGVFAFVSQLQRTVILRIQEGSGVLVVGVTDGNIGLVVNDAETVVPVVSSGSCYGQAALFTVDPVVSFGDISSGAVGIDSNSSAEQGNSTAHNLHGLGVGVATDGAEEGSVESTVNDFAVGDLIGMGNLVQNQGLGHAADGAGLQSLALCSAGGSLGDGLGVLVLTFHSCAADGAGGLALCPCAGSVLGVGLELDVASILCLCSGNGLALRIGQGVAQALCDLGCGYQSVSTGSNLDVTAIEDQISITFDAGVSLAGAGVLCSQIQVAAIDGNGGSARNCLGVQASSRLSLGGNVSVHGQLIENIDTGSTSLIGVINIQSCTVFAGDIGMGPTVGTTGSVTDSHTVFKEAVLGDNELHSTALGVYGLFINTEGVGTGLGDLNALHFQGETTGICIVVILCIPVSFVGNDLDPLGLRCAVLVGFFEGNFLVLGVRNSFAVAGSVQRHFVWTEWYGLLLQHGRGVLLRQAADQRSCTARESYSVFFSSWGLHSFFNFFAGVLPLRAPQQQDMSLRTRKTYVFIYEYSIPSTQGYCNKRLQIFH